MDKGLLKFTWEDFDKAVDAILRSLPKRAFDGVYGIPRGGLVLAVVLSHRLHIPLRDYVTPLTLVVDDISETGEALSPFKNNFTATIHYVTSSSFVPSVYAAVKAANQWVLYPWECEEEETQQLCSVSKSNREL